MQVERDPKTGNTIVTSVTPVPAAAGAPKATTVFDDGRKSIHAVGRIGDQPSTEELGQILSVIDGIGMKALLDNVSVSPSVAEAKKEQIGSNRVPESEGLSVTNHHAVSEEDNMQVDSFRSYNLDPQLLRVSCAASMENKADKREDWSIKAVENITGDPVNKEVQSLEDGPVTLVFMGYRDSIGEEVHGQEGDEGMLTVERVIITDDGEEHVIGPETLPETVKDSDDPVFQEIPLEENGAAGVKVQGEEGVKDLSSSSRKEGQMGDGTSKSKKCQCCTVM